MVETPSYTCILFLHSWTPLSSHTLPLSLSYLSLSLLTPFCSAERGLSNYLIYHSSKTDPKVAAHASDVGQYEDDEAGNLLRKEK